MRGSKKTKVARVAVAARPQSKISDIIGRGRVHESLLTPERQQMLKMVNKVMSEVYGLVYLTNFDLRVPRKAKQQIASKNPFWTIFINTAGTLGLAIHRNGSQLLLEGEYWLKGTDEAYLINKFADEFLKKLKAMSQPMLTSVK